MAKCDLAVELDEPSRVFQGGDTVRGHVSVRANKEVKCQGLKIKTMWETHGRGNVARGTHQEIVVFEGTWQAGDTARFPFELECGSWPPTYHGRHLNVDHYVHVQADVPWAIDPKAKQPFQVVPRPGQSEFEPAGKKQTLNGPASWILKLVFFSIFGIVGIVMLLNPFFWVCGGLIFAATGTWWFVKSFLPKWKLGQVDMQLLTPAVAPGQRLRGEVTMHPSGNVPLNSITWTILAREVCVHGSGTNKSTYTHSVAEYSQVSQDACVLKGGQPQRFVLDFVLPEGSPYSIDLSDNDLAWTVALRVDIPRWPDWTRTEKFQVLPVVDGSATVPNPPGATQSSSQTPRVDRGDRTRADTVPSPPYEAEVAARVPPPPPVQSAAVDFAATAAMVAKVRTNFDQLDRVIAAVAKQQMEITVNVERVVRYSASDYFAGHADGCAFEATFSPEHLPLMLYGSASRKAELQAAVGEAWTGMGEVIGYDHQVGRLQLRLR